MLVLIVLIILLNI